jgi:hypothetical protein
MIHFHSSDERFCNSKRKARQFSFDPNEVTCARCKERDSFVLSEEARQSKRPRQSESLQRRFRDLEGRCRSVETCTAEEEEGGLGRRAANNDRNHPTRLQALAMTTKDNQMKKDHENEPRSEYGNLPPELRAMQKMMDAVFGAVTKTHRYTGEPNRDVSAGTSHSEPDGSATKPAIPSSQGGALQSAAPNQFAPRRMDIETAIMCAPGFDYLLASEIFAALQRRLEVEYEDRLNTELADRMARLAKSFDNITGAA